MRQPLGAFALVLLAVAPADADRAKAGTPKPIDAKAVIDKLEVYRDDTGMYVIAPKPFEIASDDQEWLFYGTAKAMYKQRVIGSAHSKGGVSEWTVWAPRALGKFHATIKVDTSGLTLDCKKGNAKPPHLTRLPADEARTFLERATLLPPLWQRTAHFLARDDDGVYYFVDELLEEHGGKGFRVFVGQKGGMKELAMKNVVSDSAGEIFATRTGELKIIAGADGKAVWKKGGKKTELVVLEPQVNRYLIYRELGIYRALGAVCDDQ